ncbi:MAG: transglutaminase N-terminal domain-containing protein, partial [Phreatobacter sp.]|nr:transglutaminase N-terminal domain-containing protein [Phreatobacter sp.]
MIYDVRQVTDYHYARPVVFAQHVLRIVPVDRPGQSVESCRLAISPEPSGRRDDIDFFGNNRIFLDLDRPHRELRI